MPNDAINSLSRREVTDPTVNYLEDIFTVQANIAGTPAVIPIGVDSNGHIGLQGWVQMATTWTPLPWRNGSVKMRIISSIRRCTGHALFWANNARFLFY